MNAVATFLRSQHQVTITNHDHAQIRTEMTAVLQLKLASSVSWKLYISCIVSVTRND